MNPSVNESIGQPTSATEIALGSGIEEATNTASKDIEEPDEVVAKQASMENTIVQAHIFEEMEDLKATLRDQLTERESPAVIDATHAR
ncbi:hypothetical protein RB195_011028 [Necator americanus]|uniref:Uncharacterized protein n=1 Tax=Necator americanus TaxID=51031 RepID=A0ABR1D0J3_NECAM